MPSLHIVIIWALAVMFGGSLITLAVLYITRDTGQRVSGQRPKRVDATPYLARWRAATDAYRRRTEAQAAGPARCRHGNIALADGSCALDKVRKAGGPPWTTIDEDTESVLTTALIEASVRRVYADIEARQVRQLAQTVWSTWQG